MPPPKTDGRVRRRKRKARLADISSSSSSSDSSTSDSSDSESESNHKASSKTLPPHAKRAKSSDKQPAKVKKSAREPGINKDFSSTVEQQLNSKSLEPSQPSSAPQSSDDSQKKPDFDDWYLRAVTKAFANDLEKLRQAPDFKDSSVPILINALKQGADLFSDEEKAMILARSA